MQLEQSSVNQWASQAGLDVESIEVDSWGTSRVLLYQSLGDGTYAQGMVKQEPESRGGAVLVHAGLYQCQAPYKIGADGYREYETVEAGIADLKARFKVLMDTNRIPAEEIETASVASS